MSDLFYLPQQQVRNGVSLSVGGAKAYFYLTGTTTKAPIYADAELSIPLANPVIADGFGRLPVIYLDGSMTYRLRVTSPTDAPIGTDIDPYIPGTVASIITTGDAAGGYLAIAADGSIVSASGTGADDGLRTDLAADTGAILVKAADGNTVQANFDKIAFNAAAAFLASTQASQGEGSIWRSGRHSYKEAASDATDSHVTNAAGVKFYVIPSSLGYDLEAFGADMTGTNDSASVVQAAANLFPNGGTLIIPPGTLKLGSGVTMPPRLSLVGAGPTLTMVTCVGDGFDWQGSAADQAQTLVGNFAMSGAGRTTGTAITGAGGAALNRIQGMRFLNITVNNFNIAFQGRSCWHTNFIGCRVNNCSFGIRLEGQCVKILIQGCEITSLGSAYNDGSMGIYVDSYTYSDSVYRRPEDVVIDATIVYGYDRNIRIGSALSASIINSDVDAALRNAIEASTVDYGLVIDNNWVAVIHNTSGTNGIVVNALAAASTAQVSISRNRVSATGTLTNASNGIQVAGSNRTGVITVRDNNVGMGSGVGTALYLNTASKVSITDNDLLGQQYSVNSENGGGHIYERNILNGAIRRVGNRISDRFGTTNRGSAVTGYSGPVTIPANATSVTLSLTTDLGLPAVPVTATPASLFVGCHAYQCMATTGLSGGRGSVFARYDGSANIIVNVQNASTSASSDIWLDMFCA